LVVPVSSVLVGAEAQLGEAVEASIAVPYLSP
jgi:hypothetical protein